MLKRQIIVTRATQRSVNWLTYVHVRARAICKLLGKPKHQQKPAGEGSEQNPCFEFQWQSNHATKRIRCKAWI